MKELLSLDQIFTKRLFRIPDYQRGYAWGEKQYIEFWEDLISLDSDRAHYTGVLSIKAVPTNVSGTWSDVKWLVDGRGYTPYYIVDGQQRLTTISIFIQCLIEAVKSNKENKGLNDDQVYLGAYRLSEIIENLIVVKEPRHQIINTYKFGYEVDNPSFEFLRHHIFNEASAGTLKETFYTLNLENAKKFFEDNINDFVSEHGLGALEDIYKKLTQKFLFNLYEIDDNFDVFVAFETMNNRGKRLSDLELLKNRLIYLTTLYPSHQVSIDVKDTIRKKINATWGEIYNQLGQNKNAPLNDDEFLRAHWIMYFKYSRDKGDDYIRFLLDNYFSPKKVFEKITISTNKIEHVEEIRDIEDPDEYEDDVTQVESIEESSKLTIKDIDTYVDSIKVASKIWSTSFFPQNSDELSENEKLMMDKINRLKIGYFRPLIMASILKTKKGEESRLLFLKQVERFIFINFRVSRWQSNSGSSYYSRAARSIYFGENTLEEVISDLNSDLQLNVDEDGIFKILNFQNFIDKKFVKNGPGFYGWNDLRYFLFEYEEHLKQSRNQPKLGWENFTKYEGDKISIEHIYPQTDTSKYWKSRFGKYTDQKKNYLKGSLGNLLPLSSSINSSLQNDDFTDKKDTKKDAKGAVLRNGYSNGSYSELEVAGNKDWTPKEIMERGLKLLEFMEKRWEINLGNRANKLALLHLSFLEKK
ncbi:MAG TPA: DUF262 domain-containing HNH endonuclease family protein [Methylotenera sp.]|nr:DUF262 domain-containing HNH endonuclease family protein [Methylotenera sp.]